MKRVRSVPTAMRRRAARVVRRSLFTLAHGVYAGRGALGGGWRRSPAADRPFIVIDPDLIAPGGHHYEYARLLHAELGRGCVRFYAHRSARFSVNATFDVRPVFADSQYANARGAPFAHTWRSTRDSLVRDLAAVDAADLHAETIAIVHTATIFALGGLAAWYAGLPAARRPRLFVQFQHPLEFALDRAADRTEALRCAHDAAQSLRSAGVVRFAANTAACAERIARQLDVPCALTPVPIGWAGYEHSAAPEAETFGFFGGLREEKGARLLAPAFAEFSTRYPEARLIVQAPAGQSDDSAVRALQAVPGVTLIRSAFAGRARYFAALRRARWIVLPYDPAPYRMRTSGVFIEAIGLGIPVIVPAGTWMEDELRSRGVPGLVMPAYNAGALSEALAEARSAMQATGPAPPVPNTAVIAQYSAAAFCTEVRRLMST